MITLKSKRGSSVLEIIIASSIILILTMAIAGAWNVYITLSRISSEKNQAAILLDEASEIVQYLRDNGWATNIAPLSLGTPYYLTWNGTTYVPSTSESLIQNFYLRTITFSSVVRDANDDISGSGVVDTKTRKVTIAVTTNQANPSFNLQTEMLIHDIYNN